MKVTHERKGSVITRLAVPAIPAKFNEQGVKMQDEVPAVPAASDDYKTINAAKRGSRFLQVDKAICLRVVK